MDVCIGAYGGVFFGDGLTIPPKVWYVLLHLSTHVLMFRVHVGGIA